MFSTDEQQEGSGTGQYSGIENSTNKGDQGAGQEIVHAENEGSPAVTV
jgi:hypothetical protein